jgi:hypothetical protein
MRPTPTMTAKGRAGSIEIGQRATNEECKTQTHTHNTTNKERSYFYDTISNVDFIQ